MPYSTSGSSSPAGLTSGSDCSDVDTPLTERSLLFSDEDLGLTIPSANSARHILVVGGCGFIGSHTVWELAKAGFNVIVVDNLSNAFRSVFERIESMVTNHYSKRPHRRPSLKLYVTDYRDEKAMTAILSNFQAPAPFQLSPCEQEVPRTSTISGVIHFAAYKSVSESIAQPLKYYTNNVSGFISFLTLLSTYHIKNFVFSSSATVYGTVANLGLPLREEYCSQSSTTFTSTSGDTQTVEAGCSGLTNPYGRTKWMCEAILNDLAYSDPSWTITALRYFNPTGCDPSGLLGEDPRDAATNLMPVVLRVLAGNLPFLSVYGDDYDTPDGTAVRDYLHVSDLARGHLAALKREETGFRVFNLGSGRGESVLEVVKAMEDISGKVIPVRVMGRREGDVGMCVASATRADVELGWRTEKSLGDCCRDIWRFLERVAEDEGGPSPVV